MLALAWPGMTLLTLILFYGAYALVDGVLAIVAAITGGALLPRWWLAIVGLLGIAAGLLTFLMPGLTAIVLLYFIAGWAIATGVFQIIGAIKLRKEVENEMVMDHDNKLRILQTYRFPLLRPDGSPYALGSVFIDRMPASLKNVAVQHFGTHGRTVLLLGMYAAIAVLAMGIGVLARHAAAPGVAGLAAFSLIAIVTVATRPRRAD